MYLFTRASNVETLPAWLVSNGEVTVGPVTTNLLVRGVLSGKIPQNCQVSITGQTWRAVDQVREVRRARRQPGEPPPGSVQHAIRWLAGARSVTEAYSLALRGACAVTGAEVGLLYQRRDRLEPPVIAAAYGLPTLRVGEVVSRWDPALGAADDGEPKIFTPDSGPAARAMAFRLSRERRLAGLAVVPLRTALDIVGVVELGRFDHQFRATDAQALVPLIAATMARVEELSWEPVREIDQIEALGA